ncbi:MAG: hypothetical protein WCR36_08680 [Bacteroidaceae bacterium]
MKHSLFAVSGLVALFIAVMIMVSMLFSSCTSTAKKNALVQERDSLNSELTIRNAEVDNMMGMLSEVQEGIDEINKAENRLHLSQQEDGKSAKERVSEDMAFIKDRMAQNRENIERLTKLLNTSSYNNSQLKKVFVGLKKQLQESTARIGNLEQELKFKNEFVQKQAKQITQVNSSNALLLDDAAAKEQVIANQDETLHQAYFVFGTKRELKKENILVDSKVLQNPSMHQSYFTKIDVRDFKSLDLYDNHAKLLTSHPTDSYKLVKNDDGNYVLHILNVDNFWSSSRYLVVEVW